MSTLPEPSSSSNLTVEIRRFSKPLNRTSAPLLPAGKFLEKLGFRLLINIQLRLPSGGANQFAVGRVPAPFAAHCFNSYQRHIR
jgi:hypothetical protein